MKITNISHEAFRIDFTCENLFQDGKFHFPLINCLDKIKKVSLINHSHKYKV